jgi:nucleoside-diphosphate-sugar epimerase
MLIDLARRRTGVAAYVGDGANRWPAVHRLDAARLFRLALEQAPPATRLHATAEAGMPMRAIAETIAGGLGIPARGLSGEQVAAHFGWMAFFVGMDNPTSSAFTRKLLEWQPTGPELLVDLRDAGYLT